MPWDDTARRQHNRAHLRYPSDLTDQEWFILEPFIPEAKPGGRPRKTDMREVMNAILYLASGGCPWRMLPKDFPPASTARGYFYAWRDTGIWQTMSHLLVMSVRELEGREASPTAGVIDSQSVKTTESGGICGYDAGKNVKGRKRHCPKCQSGAAKAWLAAREAELLPVGYFHLVFTLPKPIADIAYQNKRAIYHLLMRVSADTVLKIAADPKHLGAQLGITSVLHTWGCAMTHHPHVHMIVPGGGLSPDASQWIPCRRTFFLSVRVLSRLFRRLFLKGTPTLPTLRNTTPVFSRCHAQPARDA